MADNISATQGSGTTLATDDIAGVHYPRVKITCGADGTATDVTIGGGVEAAAMRVTIASDSTGVLSVDDNGGSLTVDGTVAISAVVPGTGATDLGKAEDAAHASGNVGVMALAVRNDAGTALAADGDYIPLTVDSSGNLRVTSSGGGGGGTEYTQDAAAAANPVGGAVIVVRDDARSGSITSADGDNIALRGTNAGELYVKHVDAIPITDNSGSITVDGTVALSSVIPGTGATNLGKAEDAAHSSGDVGIMALAVRNDAGTALAADGDYIPLSVDSSGNLRVTSSGGGGGGTEYTQDAAAAATPVGGAVIVVRDDARSGSITSANGDNIALRGTNSGELYVKHVDAIPITDNSGSITVDNAGTFAVQATISAALPAGTNAIGKLAANSGVDIGDVDVTSMPARARTTDTISSALATDAIMNGTTALTPKYAAIDVATSGDNTLVGAVASKKIRVLSLYMVAAGAVNVRFESGAGGTALSGQMNLTTNSGFVLPFNPVGWFETASNTLLNLELSGAVSVDGSLVYVEV